MAAAKELVTSAVSAADTRALSVQVGFSATPRDMHWLRGSIPCQAACPAHTDIPGYLEAIHSGEYDRAYQINLRDNVFPGVLGRVCSRPCEPACRHGFEGNGESVAICASKRAGADMRSNKDPVRLEPLFDKTDKRIAVIGGGVAGLAAARELALFGHTVTVYEKHERAGGMLNQGIPTFRLPRDVIDLEIEQVRAVGVDVQCGVEIGKDITTEQLLADNDAIVLATGTLRPNRLALPGSDLAGIEHGLDFLFEVNERGRRSVGKKVVVIGGGYTSMDCARTAIRLGVKGLKVYYRRREQELLILPDELVQLRQEAGWMEFCCNPVEFHGENGHVTGIRFVRTSAGEPDERGRCSAVPIPGTEFDVEADHVILATGQFPDLAWLDADLARELVAQDGWLAGGTRPVTSHPKVFVAGDSAMGATTLIDAIGHAKDCARQVDTALMGRQRMTEAANVQDARGTGRSRSMDFIDRQPMPTIPCAQRALEAEVETGYGPQIAKVEASRCYLCHYKFEIDDAKCVLCDECLFVKPVDNCIVEISQLTYGPRGEITGYEPFVAGKSKPLYYSRLYIDQTQCIRCGACEQVCPTDAISIQKVSWQSTPVSALA